MTDEKTATPMDKTLLQEIAAGRALVGTQYGGSVSITAKAVARCAVELVAERDALRAELDRMRPVVEAAGVWKDSVCDCDAYAEEGHYLECSVSKAESGLAAAVSTYRGGREASKG